MKTWSNSWSTSYRYHEARRLPCLFGCPGEPDSLSHYCQCSVMRSLILETLGQPEDWNGLDQLGIAHPSRNSLKCIACMFYAYHALKFSSGVVSVTTVSVETDSASHIDSTTTIINIPAARRIFVGAFQAAASSAGVECQHMT